MRQIILCVSLGVPLGLEAPVMTPNGVTFLSLCCAYPAYFCEV